MDLVKDLTKRQREIFDFIGTYLSKHGYPPTVREIGKAVGLHSSSTVHAHLSKLESLGVLRRDPSKPRALEVMVERAKKAVRPSGLPLVGPGRRRLADPRRGEHRGLPRGPRRGRRGGRRLHPPSARREHEGRRHPGGGLRRGAPHGARPRRRDRGRPGRSDEATVKRFFREKDRVRLQPENKSMKPIRTRDARLLGRVVGVFRRVP